MKVKGKIISLLVVIFLSISVASVTLGSSNDVVSVTEEDMAGYEDDVTCTGTETVSDTDTVTDVPTLDIGDNWTYNREVHSETEEMGSIYFIENFTYTVSAIETYTYNETEYYGYNLTLEGEIVEGEFGDEDIEVEIESGEVEGYLFLRMSDLGMVVNYEWRRMEGNVTMRGDTYPVHTIRETLAHDDPPVEEFDFPIELDGEFYANTTRRSRNYQKIEVEGLPYDEESTTYQNTSIEQHAVTSPMKEDVSVPAGSFNTFELNKTSLDEDEEGYMKHNYAPEVKSNVRSRAYHPEDDTEMIEELLDYNVSDISESLSISPRSEKPGEEVTVFGSFPDHPGEDIRIWIPEADEDHSVTTDPNGDFEINIEVPFASDRTYSPGELGSIGVIAQLQDYPKEAYAVSTLVVEAVPTIEIVSPEEGDLVLESEVTVEWDSEHADRHEVRVNEEDWEDADTETNHTFTLEDGEHTIDVKAIGEDETDTDTVNITVDAEPPQIDIISPEEGEILTEDEVTIEWKVEEGSGPIGVDHHQVRLDDGDWIDVDTETSYGFTEVDEGDHTAEVRVWDEEERSDTDSVSFQVETEPKLEVHEFFITPHEGPVPLDVDIIAEIENLGIVDRTVYIYADEEEIHSEIVEADDEIKIDFNHTFEEPGEIEIELFDEDDNKLGDTLTLVAVEQYDMTVNIEGEGTVTIEWDGEEKEVEDEETIKIEEGTEVTLTVEADEDWEFKEWTGIDETGDTVTMTMTDDKEVTATFEEKDEEEDDNWTGIIIGVIVVIGIVIAVVVYMMMVKGGEETDMEREEGEEKEGYEGGL